MKVKLGQLFVRDCVKENYLKGKTYLNVKGD